MFSSGFFVLRFDGMNVLRSSELVVLSVGLDHLQEDRQSRCCSCCLNNPRGEPQQ